MQHLAGLESGVIERVLLVGAGLFVLLGFLLLEMTGRLSPGAAALAAATWAASFLVAHLALDRFLPGRDPILVPVIALLSGWGLIEIARLAPAFLTRQAIWLPISVGALLAVAVAPRDLRWLRRYRYTWLTGGLLLLAATLFFGVNPSGASVERLWLRVGPAYLQPSELCKPLFVAYLASYLAEKRQLITTAGPLMGRFRLPSLPFLAPLVAVWGLALLLLASQQDLGAALLFFFTFLAMLYIASGQAGYVVGGLGLFALSAAIAYKEIARVAFRVDIWLNPWPEASGRAFQIVQSLIALASGGIVGQGLAQGSPTMVPVVHSDFVFAAIGEEFGLLGTIAVILLFVILTARGLGAATRAHTPFAQLLGAGLAVLLGLQAWVIMAGNVRLIPLTGVTLPFLSYGGSSLLVSCVTVGLLLIVSDRGE